MADKPWRPQTLNLDKPLYIAIADALEKDIRAGLLQPGQRLPPQRDLAKMIGVNLSTLTRAFRESETRGLISGTVGRGTYIASDVQVPAAMSSREESDDCLLEMGLVLPLYELDDKTAAEIGSLLQCTDLAPLLRYTEPAGSLRHRAVGSDWIGRVGLAVTPQDILVTSGSQNALACCLMSLLSSGDRLAVDAFTYPGIKTLASMLGIRLVPIETDASGMNPSALSAACRRDGVRGVFLMPEVQNPTTVSLSDERREEVAALIKRHDLVLIEDESYGFTGRPGHFALSSLVPDHGIYIAGISKLLGAGLRISFTAAPPRFRGQLEKAILNTVWMASPLSAELVSQLLISGRANAISQAKREEAGRRTALALAALSPYTVFSRPAGFFLWLRLPAGWTGREFELAARAQGVRVFCAEKFMVGNRQPFPAVRISLTGPETIADLSRGLAILTGILTAGHNESEMIF
ncbi:MAG: PLP-dependent aminotransferase family protein [Negativicutes bacterium]|nr:PLP-dependent aminotransferase family protein [Negativicutes bacterium]